MSIATPQSIIASKELALDILHYRESRRDFSNSVLQLVGLRWYRGEAIAPDLVERAAFELASYGEMNLANTLLAMTGV